MEHIFKPKDKEQKHVVNTLPLQQKEGGLLQKKANSYALSHPLNNLREKANNSSEPFINGNVNNGDTLEKEVNTLDSSNSNTPIQAKKKPSPEEEKEYAHDQDEFDIYLSIKEREYNEKYGGENTHDPKEKRQAEKEIKKIKKFQNKIESKKGKWLLEDLEKNRDNKFDGDYNQVIEKEISEIKTRLLTNLTTFNQFNISFKNNLTTVYEEQQPYTSNLQALQVNIQQKLELVKSDKEYANQIFEEHNKDEHSNMMASYDTLITQYNSLLQRIQKATSFYNTENDEMSAEIIGLEKDIAETTGLIQHVSSQNDIQELMKLEKSDAITSKVLTPAYQNSLHQPTDVTHDITSYDALINESEKLNTNANALKKETVSQVKTLFLIAQRTNTVNGEKIKAEDNILVYNISIQMVFLDGSSELVELSQPMIMFELKNQQEGMGYSAKDFTKEVDKSFNGFKDGETYDMPFEVYKEKYEHAFHPKGHGISNEVFVHPINNIDRAAGCKSLGYLTDINMGKLKKEGIIAINSRDGKYQSEISEEAFDEIYEIAQELKASSVKLTVYKNLPNQKVE